MAGKGLRRTLEQPSERVTSPPFGYINESNPFGYVNEDDPFCSDQSLLGPWWEKAFDSDRLMTHEMLSDVLWHCLMMTARSIRYKYIRFVPRQQNMERQRAEAMAQIVKFQLLLRMAMNWHSVGLVLQNRENFAWLHSNLEGMQVSFEKRYNAHRVYD